MDGMKSSDLLSPLTAERLEELKTLTAAWQAEAAFYGDADEAEAFAQLAAICEALAGAERWMLADPVDRTLSASTRLPDFFEAFDARIGNVGGHHPTLIAALGAVAKQEETT